MLIEKTGETRPCSKKAWPRFYARVLPNPAGIHRHHGLTCFAPESFAKLRHVLHHAIGAKLPGRVRICLHLETKLFGTRVAAPALPVP